MPLRNALPKSKSSLPIAVTALAAAIIGVLSLCASTGCVVVKPYQRENFAKTQMTLDADALELADEIHTLQAREGAAGGYGSGGGGCGCN